ncbi:hypothetical protein GcM1_250015 [Golovinomyces cichoracearum]|uniref:Uncharacterized protein n=1 Tax=Golovinomyces cichoracearum TaxID=62708 RepID=A0A420IAL5_9PEZI|nr:hypothetical protein GcM1_250015 [Golovinomyces cichoracearum]
MGQYYGVEHDLQQGSFIEAPSMRERSGSSSATVHRAASSALAEPLASTSQCRSELKARTTVEHEGEHARWGL